MSSSSSPPGSGPPTPPPPGGGGGGPSPLVIGRTFLKQYYQVLSSDHPENVTKFYKPRSLLSHGEGSQLTVPVTIESLGPSGLLQDRLFNSTGFRLELEHGAIDAQESVGGGVLVVVTGHMYLSDKRRAFCHTFFLNPYHQEGSQRKQYYVHNDVLRFLFEEDEEGTEENGEEAEVPAATEPPPAPAAVVVEPEVVVEGTAEEVKEEGKAVEEENVVDEIVPEKPTTVVEEPVVEMPTVEETIVVQEEKLPAPILEPAVEETKEEPAVEETKEEPAVEETKEEETAAPAAVAVVKDETTKPSRRKSKSRRDGRKKTPSPPNAPKTPNSWASLVASGGSGATPKASMSPVRPTKTAALDKEEKKNSADSPASKDDAAPSTKPAVETGRRRRDPDCTIVIKNMMDSIKESDVRALFEPFAKETKAKIVGINVSGSRGLGFVDYDSPAPVLLALKQKDRLELNGRMLDVEQKNVDGRGRRSGRRSGSPGNKEGGGASNGGRGGRSSSRRHASRGSGGGGGGGGGRGGRTGGK